MNEKSKEQANNNAVVWFIQCTVGEMVYGLEMDWVRSIQRVDQMRLDDDGKRQDGWIGWIFVQNDEVPVYDLALRMDMEGAYGAQARIIVLNDPERPWALLVDRVSQVMSGTMGRLHPFPAAAINREAHYFESILVLDERLLLFLAPKQLHPKAEPVEAIESERPQRSSPQTRLLSDGKEGQLVVFYAPDVTAEASFLYGLSITQVAEVLEWPEITLIPHAPEYLVGLINWRDYPIPIINLGKRLGLPLLNQKLGKHERVLVARVGEHAFIGLVVHPQVQVWRLPFVHRPGERPLTVPNSMIRQAAQVEGETLLCLDLTELLTFKQLDYAL